MSPQLPPLHLLSTEPDAAFWRNDLGFAPFQTLHARFHDPVDPGWTRKVCNKLYTGPINRPLRDQILQQAHSPDLALQHLVLVASFIERVRTIAITEVAQTLLSEEALESCSRGKQKWERVALTLLLYLHDPRSLLSVMISDRWNTRVRCVMKVVGRVPSPKEPITATQVLRAAQAFAVRRHRSTRAKGELIVLHAFSRKEDEVLVACRRLYGVGSLRRPDNELITGRNEELFILRFMDRAHRVDITALRLQEATELARIIGSELLGTPITYEKRREPLTSSVLNEFLARACDPGTDDLQLVEIKAELSGEPGHLVQTVHGPGHARIEHAVQRIAETSPFARDWRTVHSIKILFEGYRFQIHFPLPHTRPLTLTYSDTRRDTEVAEALERMVEQLCDEFGADIRLVPRSQEVQEETCHRRRTTVPRLLTREHWQRLLHSPVDDPADWECERLQRLEDEGLLSRRTAFFFRCGDPSIDRVRAGVPEEGLDCTGEVEWSATAGDPLDGVGEQLCPVCNTAWDLGRYRPPIYTRHHLDFDHAALWAFLLQTCAPFVHLQPERPGIASGMRGGMRLYVVYLPLISPRDAHLQARGQPIAWLSTVGDTRLVGLPGGDLADLWTGQATIERILDAHLGHTPAAPAGSVSPAPQLRPPLTALPPFGQLVVVGGSIQFHAYHSAAEQAGGRPYRTWDVLAPHAHAGRLLLALLADAAAEDGPEPLYRPLTELLARNADLHRLVKPQVFYKWVKGVRDKLDAVVEGLGAAVVESTPDRRGRGYRLGSRYPAPSFQFSEEVEKWKLRSTDQG